MKAEELLFSKSESNWEEELNRRFSQVPSSENRKAYNNFLHKIYEEYQSHINRKKSKTVGSGFPWFFQALKMANKRLGEESIFIYYLMLCITRPWERGEFLLDWKGKKEDFDKAHNILINLKKNFGMKFSSTLEGAWKKIFYRYKKNEMIRSLICSLYTQDYSDYYKKWEGLRDYKKFVDLLKSGFLVTKREYRRKLQMNSDRLDLLIKHAQEKGILKEMNLSKNSVGLLYISSQKNRR